MINEIKNMEEQPEELKPNRTDEIGRLVLENNEMLKEILVISRKTKSYLVTQNVMLVLKVLIIAIPLILSIIFLPPLLKEVLKPYQELLNLGGVTGAQPVEKLKNYLK